MGAILGWSRLLAASPHCFRPCFKLRLFVFCWDLDYTEQTFQRDFDADIEETYLTGLYTFTHTDTVWTAYFLIRVGQLAANRHMVLGHWETAGVFLASAGKFRGLKVTCVFKIACYTYGLFAHLIFSIRSFSREAESHTTPLCGDLI